LHTQKGKEASKNPSKSPSKSPSEVVKETSVACNNALNRGDIDSKNGNLTKTPQNELALLTQNIELVAKNIQGYKEQVIDLRFNDAKSQEIEALVEATNKSLTAIYETFELNAFGQVLHPLEAEVQFLISQAEDGEKRFSTYDRHIHGTPLDYLEENFGKYLSKYNGGKGDFLYLDQLGSIVGSKFKADLKSYAQNHSKNLNGYIKIKLVRINNNYTLLTESLLPLLKNSKEIKSLSQIR